VLLFSWQVPVKSVFDLILSNNSEQSLTGCLGDADGTLTKSSPVEYNRVWLWRIQMLQRHIRLFNSKFLHISVTLGCFESRRVKLPSLLVN